MFVTRHSCCGPHGREIVQPVIMGADGRDPITTRLANEHTQRSLGRRRPPAMTRMASANATATWMLLRMLQRSAGQAPQQCDHDARGCCSYLLPWQAVSRRWDAETRRIERDRGDRVESKCCETKAAFQSETPARTIGSAIIWIAWSGATAAVSHGRFVESPRPGVTFGTSSCLRPFYRGVCARPVVGE